MGSIHPASWKPGYCLNSMVNMSSLTSKNQDKLGEVCWRLGDWELINMSDTSIGSQIFRKFHEAKRGNGRYSVYFPFSLGNGRYSHPYCASAGKFSTKRTLDALPSGSPLAASPIAGQLGWKTLFAGHRAVSPVLSTGGGTTCIWDFQKKTCWKTHMPRSESKLLISGMVIRPLTGNPYNGYINPYCKVDDHPTNDKTCLG